METAARLFPIRATRALPQQAEEVVRWLLTGHGLVGSAAAQSAEHQPTAPSSLAAAACASLCAPFASFICIKAVK